MDFSDLQLGDGSGEGWGSATNQLLNSVGDVFGEQWARRQQARLFAVDRKCRQWATATVLLTATASTTWPGSASTAIPPVVHYKRGVRATRSARQSALSRALSGRKWRAIRCLGVGDDGYLHAHTGVYLDERVDSSDLDPWVSAHTNNSPLADDQAHSGAVEIAEVDGDEHTGLVNYVMCNSPGLDTRGDRGHGLQSAPTNQQRGAVVIDRGDVSPVTFGSVST